MKITRKKLLGQLKFSSASKIYLSIINFMVNVQLARLFTPDDLGRFFLIFSIITAASIIGQLGLRVAAIRLLPKNIAENRRAVYMVTLLLLMVGVIGALGITFLIYLLSGLFDQAFATNVFKTLLFYICLWSFLSTTNTLLAEINRGLLQIRTAIAVSGVISSSSVCAILLVNEWQGISINMEGLLMLYCFSSIICIAVSLLSIFRNQHMKIHWDNESWQPQLQAIVDLAKISFVTSILLVVINQASTWVVSSMLTIEAMGYFGLLIRFQGLIGMPLMIMRSFLPANISSLYSQNRYEQIFHINRIVTLGLVVYGIAALLGWYTMGTIFIVTFFGEAYLILDDLMTFAIIATIGRYLFGIAPSLMEVCDKNRQYMKITTSSGIIGMSMLVPLTNTYGMNGAVAGHMLMTIMPAFLCYIVIKYHLQEKMRVFNE